ncbi:MAG: nucleotide exchange factor GrpE [Phycisphaeraceae bacterium]|nr:nucleotide exchange factor GrpE [Phycisphaeraceae bacterium]
MSQQEEQADEPFEIGDAEEYFASQEGKEAPDAGEQEAESAEQGLLSRLQAERDELESKLLRVSADYQNFARRAQQNADSAVEQKLMDIARGLVTVLDHFDRALEGQDKDNETGVLQGVVMVHNELLATLNRFGIERLDVDPGTEFDPNQHEALMRQPSGDFESNQVTMQMQPGYVLGDKIIRPAQVGVAE